MEEQVGVIITAADQVTEFAYTVAGTTQLHQYNGKLSACENC